MTCSVRLYAPVLLAVAIAYVLFGIVFDAYIVSEDNCAAGEDAVCLESLFFIEALPSYNSP